MIQEYRQHGPKFRRSLIHSLKIYKCQCNINCDFHLNNSCYNSSGLGIYYKNSGYIPYIARLTLEEYSNKLIEGIKNNTLVILCNGCRRRQFPNLESSKFKPHLKRYN